MPEQESDENETKNHARVEPLTAGAATAGTTASSAGVVVTAVETTPETVEALYEAVKHTLDQIQINPDLHYYAGFGTQVFYLLVRAEAAHLGISLDTVETARRKDRQPDYRRREPEVLRLRDQLDELRQQVGM